MRSTRPTGDENLTVPESPVRIAMTKKPPLLQIVCPDAYTGDILDSMKARGIPSLPDDKATARSRGFNSSPATT